MTKPLQLIFECHECGAEHCVPLDGNGHWEGNCSAPECEAPLSVQVDPEAWAGQRALHAAVGGSVAVQQRQECALMRAPVVGDIVSWWSGARDSRRDRHIGRVLLLYANVDGKRMARV